MNILGFLLLTGTLVFVILWLVLKVLNDDKPVDNENYKLSITPGTSNYQWWKGTLTVDNQATARTFNAGFNTISSSSNHHFRNIVSSATTTTFDMFITDVHSTEVSLSFLNGPEKISKTFNTGSSYHQVNINQFDFDTLDTHVIQSTTNLGYKPASNYMFNIGLINADVNITISLKDSSGDNAGTVTISTDNVVTVYPTKTGSLTLDYNVSDTEGNFLFNKEQTLYVTLVPLNSTTISFPNVSAVFTYILGLTSDANASNLTLTWPSATVYAQGTQMKYQLITSEALTNGQSVATTWTHTDGTIQNISFTLSVTGSSVPGIYPVVVNMVTGSYTSNMGDTIVNPSLKPAVTDGNSYQKSGSTTTLYLQPSGWIDNSTSPQFHLIDSTGKGMYYVWFREKDGSIASSTAVDDLGMLTYTNSGNGLFYSMCNAIVSNQDQYFLSFYTGLATQPPKKKGVTLSALFNTSDAALFSETSQMVYINNVGTDFEDLSNPTNLSGNFLFFPTRYCERTLVNSKSAIVPLLTNSITMTIDYPLYLDTVSTVASNIIDLTASRGIMAYTSSSIFSAVESGTGLYGQWHTTDGEYVYNNLNASSYLPEHGDMVMDNDGNRIIVVTKEELKLTGETEVAYGQHTILTQDLSRTSLAVVSYSATDDKACVAIWDPDNSDSANLTLTSYTWTASLALNAYNGYVTLSSATSHANSVKADTVRSCDEGTVFACNLSNTTNTFVSLSGGTLTVDNTIPDGYDCGFSGSYFWYLQDMTSSQTAHFTTISDTDTTVVSLTNLPATGKWEGRYDATTGKARMLHFLNDVITVYDSTNGIIYNKTLSNTVYKVRFATFDSYFALLGTTASQYTLVTGKIVS